MGRTANITGRPPRIVISGWYGAGNAGDEAILMQFVEGIRAHHPDAAITVLTESPDAVRRDFGPLGVDAAHHWSVFSLKGLNALVCGQLGPQFRALRQADLFVLGGGSLLRDNTSWRNIIRLLDEIWFARLLGIPAALYAVGVGPFRTAFGRWLIARSTSLCRVITVRDETSAALLRDAGVAAARVQVVADPAFLLRAEPPKDLSLPALDQCIGLYLTEGLYWDLPIADRAALIAGVAHALDRLHLDFGLTILALPLQSTPYADDRRVAAEIRTHMRHPDAMISLDHTPGPRQIKYITGQTRLTVTVRLHTAIFSIAEGTPVVALNYEPKIANILRDVGLADNVIAIGADAGATLYQRAAQMLRDESAQRSRLAARRQDLLDKAARTFALIAEAIDKP